MLKKIRYYLTDRGGNPEMNHGGIILGESLAEMIRELKNKYGNRLLSYSVLE